MLVAYLKKDRKEIKIMFQIKKSFTSSSSLVPKKTSSAIEAGDSEEGQDAVPLGS